MEQEERAWKAMSERVASPRALESEYAMLQHGCPCFARERQLGATRTRRVRVRVRVRLYGC